MRPFVFLNAATTLDGKLAPANRRFVPFGGPRDLDLLYRLRASAEALIVGARTVDSVPGHFGPGPARYRRMRLKRGLAEYNLRVVVSGSGSLNPRAEIFRHRFGPIIVLATGSASRARLARLRTVADAVEVFGERTLDFIAALDWLRQEWGVKRLLCEGGGELNAALLRLGLVDEIYQTVCPLIFGGRNAPTLADGEGVRAVKDALRVRLKSLRRIGGELFLVWRMKSQARRALAGAS